MARFNMVELVRDALSTMAIISGIPLAACVVVGLIISVLQAATQVQEQSIGFAAKGITVIFVFATCSTWFGAEILRLVQESFEGIQQVGRW